MLFPSSLWGTLWNARDRSSNDICLACICICICILLGRIYSCPEGKGARGLQRPLRRCPTSPTPHLHTKDSHSTGITLLFSNSAWVLLRPTELSTFKELWDGTSGLSSLSEKTRKSNHLQMKLQREHFLLSYLKTLSVGRVGASNSQPPASQPGEQPSELPVGGLIKPVVLLLLSACF